MRSILIAIAFLIAGSLSAQQLSSFLICNSGNHNSGSTAMLSWSLGELVIETVDNGTTVLTQGFQQIYDIGTFTEELTNDYGIAVYPNPFSEYFIVSSKSEKPFFVTVYDMSGKQLTELIQFDVCKRISLSVFQPGMYLLSISDENHQRIQSFRIIKQ